MSEKVRHLRTRGTYEVLGVGRLQTDYPLGDESDLVIYRGEDGKLWARPPEEFDARFEDVVDGRD